MGIRRWKSGLYFQLREIPLLQDHGQHFDVCEFADGGLAHFLRPDVGYYYVGDPYVLHYQHAFPYPIFYDYVSLAGESVVEGRARFPNAFLNDGDSSPQVFWVQAPTNGGFGGSLPPLVITPVHQPSPSLHPENPSQLQ